VPAPDPSALQEELLERMRAGVGAPIGDADFDRLALAAFHHQYDHNAPYRAYCRSRGATPGSVTGWPEIPAVPTSAFKAVPLVCGSPAEAAAVFRTSGTTRGRERRGEHYVPDLALYHASLRASFEAHLLPDRARLPVLSLVPPPAELPDSSLSHMVATVADAFGARGGGWYSGGDGVDVAGLLGALRAAIEEGTAVCLVGTSFALVHLLDALVAQEERVSLPPGSRVMDTGGFKGRSREVPREALYAMIGERLGVGAAWCVNEYGMTEMGSQFYDTAAGDADGAEVGRRLYRGPPWVRTRAVDPETLALLPDGEPGILRHWDLANLGSVAAIQTEDLGVCEAGGFRLHGRAAGAEPRGCSLAMEELLSAVSRRERA
jgi:hypothetical protein